MTQDFLDALGYLVSAYLAGFMFTVPFLVIALFKISARGGLGDFHKS